MSRDKDKTLYQFAQDLEDLRDIEQTEIAVGKVVEALGPSTTLEELTDFIIRTGRKSK